MASEYAKAWIEGTITERNDAEALNNLFVQTYGEGVATIENYTNAEGTTFDNYYTVMLTPWTSTTTSSRTPRPKEHSRVENGPPLLGEAGRFPASREEHALGAEYVLQMKNITKRYGETTVLSDVSLSVRPGEIHALLGENGAGKSTLMNVLFGMPVIHTTGGFDGEVLIDGEKASILTPNDAMNAGIGMVHQEFMLLPGFTITENIKLNREITRPTILSRALHLKNMEISTCPPCARTPARRSDSVGMSLDENTLVKGLPWATCSSSRSPARSTKRASVCWCLMSRPPF